MIASLKPRMDSALTKKKTDSTDPKTKGRVNPSELRIQTLKVSELQSLVDDARHWLDATEGFLHELRKEQIDEITVDGATKLDRAVQLLTDFSSYCFRGTTQALSAKRRNQAQQPKQDLPKSGTSETAEK
ncbi:MAG: hypothetical protein WCH39_01715 [Schlesneria sp.]